MDRTLPQNPHVQILPKAGGWIALSPLEPQPEPENLLALKADLAARWPMTGLLDMLKETDLRVGFTRRLPQRHRLREHWTGPPCSNGCCCASTAWAPTPASSG